MWHKQYSKLGNCTTSLNTEQASKYYCEIKGEGGCLYFSFFSSGRISRKIQIGANTANAIVFLSGSFGRSGLNETVPLVAFIAT